MKTIIFVLLTMITFIGCGIESDSSVSLSSSITINVDTGGTDSNGTNPDDPEPSTTELTLFSSQPSDATQDVAVDSNITMTFNNSLDSTTVDEASFSFAKDGTNVLFSVTGYSSNTVTLKTDEVMGFDSSYVVGINSSLKDIYSNSISGTATVSFTTASEATDPVVDSIYDAKACGHVDYKAIVDNSLYPAATFSSEYGMGVTSYYPKSISGASKSEVILFHPLNLENELDNLSDILVIASNYSFSYDRVWLQNSNKTIYIMSPKDDDDNFECYRYELNSTNTSDIRDNMVLVHRDY